MDESPAVPPQASAPQFSSPVIWFRRIVCFSLSLLGVCVIGKLGSQLYRELSALSTDLAVARDREPVGYIGISAEQPEIKPNSCVIEREGRVLLWAGSGVKGQPGWFDVTATNMPVKQFAYAFGRDRIKTIDYPILQRADGEIARRIYPERKVLGIVYKNIARAYPLTVMEKVEVVNDTFDGDHVAVTFCPLIKAHAAYSRMLDQTVVSLGTSGYCYDGKFILYDRRTDSLWYPSAEGLTAITGTLVGKTLPPIGVPCELTTWSDWLRRHPESDVVVGGDRSRGIPFPADGVASM